MHPLHWEPVIWHCAFHITSLITKYFLYIWYNTINLYLDSPFVIYSLHRDRAVGCISQIIYGILCLVVLIYSVSILWVLYMIKRSIIIVYSIFSARVCVCGIFELPTKCIIKVKATAAAKVAATRLATIETVFNYLLFTQVYLKPNFKKLYLWCGFTQLLWCAQKFYLYIMWYA